MVQKPTAWRAKHRRSDEDGCKQSWPSGSALYQPQRPQDGGEATPRPGSSPRLCSSANWSQEHHIFIQLCRSRREHSTANVNENRWSTSDTKRPRETLRRDSKLYGTRDGRQVHVQWKLYWMLTQLQLGFVDVRGCRIKTWCSCEQLGSKHNLRRWWFSCQGIWNVPICICFWNVGEYIFAELCFYLQYMPVG